MTVRIIHVAVMLLSVMDTMKTLINSISIGVTKAIMTKHGALLIA